MWSQFDTDVCEILKAMAKGEVDSQLEAMTVVIVSYAAERFGHVESRNTKLTYSRNCRAIKTYQLRHLALL